MSRATAKSGGAVGSNDNNPMTSGRQNANALPPDIVSARPAGPKKRRRAREIIEADLMSKSEDKQTDDYREDITLLPKKRTKHNR
jgi:hypothetical protein